MAISNIDDNYYLNLTLGIGMYLLTGAIAGVIFTIIGTTIKKFRIDNFKKGIMEGIVYSIIIFIVLYSNYYEHGQSKSSGHHEPIQSRPE
jgi:uncharacterized membrane protein YvlD (DUF360 family)